MVVGRFGGKLRALPRQPLALDLLENAICPLNAGSAGRLRRLETADVLTSLEVQPSGGRRTAERRQRQEQRDPAPGLGGDHRGCRTREALPLPRIVGAEVPDVALEVAARIPATAGVFTLKRNENRRAGGLRPGIVGIDLPYDHASALGLCRADLLQMNHEGSQLGRLDGAEPN